MNKTTDLTTHSTSDTSHTSSRHIDNNKLVMIRGAGDIATGVAVRLHNAGFHVMMTDLAQPTVIRRSVSFAQSLYHGSAEVEGVKAIHAKCCDEITSILEKECIAVLVDHNCCSLDSINPRFVVDAVLAKENLGTHKQMAPITIALGPGFTAGQDCHAVIETNRGHYLGKIIYQGKAQDNTGIPGNIAGFTYQRVVRAPNQGVMHTQVALGDIVTEGDIIGHINDTPIYAPISGMVRGLLSQGLTVNEGFKIGDIDPRGIDADYTTISDKARAISGSVLEAMMYLDRKTAVS